MAVYHLKCITLPDGTTLSDMITFSTCNGARVQLVIPCAQAQALPTASNTTCDISASILRHAKPFTAASAAQFAGFVQQYAAAGVNVTFAPAFNSSMPDTISAYASAASPTDAAMVLAGAQAVLSSPKGLAGLLAFFQLTCTQQPDGSTLSDMITFTSCNGTMVSYTVPCALPVGPLPTGSCPIYASVYRHATPFTAPDAGRFAGFIQQYAAANVNLTFPFAPFFNSSMPYTIAAYASAASPDDAAMVLAGAQTVLSSPQALAGLVAYFQLACTQPAGFNLSDTITFASCNGSTVSYAVPCTLATAPVVYDPTKTCDVYVYIDRHAGSFSAPDAAQFAGLVQQYAANGVALTSPFAGFFNDTLPNVIAAYGTATNVSQAAIMLSNAQVILNSPQLSAAFIMAYNLTCVTTSMGTYRDVISFNSCNGSQVELVMPCSALPVDTSCDVQVYVERYNNPFTSADAATFAVMVQQYATANVSLNAPFSADFNTSDPTIVAAIATAVNPANAATLLDNARGIFASPLASAFLARYGLVCVNTPDGPMVDFITFSTCDGSEVTLSAPCPDAPPPAPMAISSAACPVYVSIVRHAVPFTAGDAVTFASLAQQYGSRGVNLTVPFTGSFNASMPNSMIAYATAADLSAASTLLGNAAFIKTQPQLEVAMESAYSLACVTGPDGPIADMLTFHICDGSEVQLVVACTMPPSSMP